MVHLHLSLLCFGQITKTLDEARSAMLSFTGDEDLGALQDHTASQTQEPNLAKRRANLQETEMFYFTVSGGDLSTLLITFV